MKLSDVATTVNGKLHGADCQIDVVSTDTRTLKPNELFVALKGPSFDAEEFLSLVSDTACGAIVARHHSDIALPQIVVKDTTMALGQLAAEVRKRFKGQLAAITGSTGKTSVKGMLGGILEQAGPCLVTRGNRNNQIGLPLTLLELKDQAYAVIEMGTSEPGEIHLLTKICTPDIALVNNVSSAHYEGFGSIEAIAQEKSQIYSTLKDKQIAVINLDDTFSQNFLLQTSHVFQMGYTLESQHTELDNVSVVFGRDLIKNDNGCYTFTIIFRGHHAVVTLSVPGKHNVYNALAATTIALAMNIDMPVIAASLSGFKNIHGRLESKPGRNGSLIIDDSYNANPASVRAAIDCLAGYAHRKKILVLGDMAELGAEAEISHEHIGQYAKDHGNLVRLYVVGDYAQSVAAAYGPEALTFDSQSALSAALCQALDSNTVCLVKGSRSAAMEKVVHALVAMEESTC